MPNSVTSRDDEQEHRPGAVLFVYTWDLALAIFALFGALAPFAGAVQSSTGVKPLPLSLQVIAAVSSAAYAATLIIIAALLTRPRAWVRLTQIGTLGTAIALAAISIAVGAIVGNGIAVTPLLVTLFFVLLDGLAIVVMTERRVVGWYDQPASVPVYVWATLVLWIGGSAITIIVGAILH
ncbi:MAG: hypothetical protein QOE18_106 [Chloroflexota bacterium]|nr:hypothetical protein [Chloroflexota bacterium]